VTALGAKASAQEVRAWIAAHLDPLEERHRETSFFDLQHNPAWGLPTESPTVPAAVLVPLVERERGLSVILTRRADKMRKHSGQVALPGGRADPGEMAHETALREAHEEISLDPKCVTLAGLSTPFRTQTGYLITPVVGFVESDVVLTPNPAEVAAVFETPFGMLMDPANYEQRFIDTADGQRRSFYAMAYEDQLIWGVTAAVLRALYGRLYGAALG
jgi:8-oxo-dGTP pyrophosphatase MutT (NUDIX family)